MSEFQTDIDIGSRACQHCGVPRLDPVLGFSDPNSKAAGEIGFVYGKLRQAELQRNFWTFAIKKAVLRAVDTATMLLQPAVWVQSTTYFFGSIVSDSSGNPWISIQPNNLGNNPQSTPAWVPYFGPVTVSLYDTTQGYFAGELVYTAPGDGTAKVFVSLQNANSDNPATATAWSATTTYFKNQVVTYLSVAYMSRIDLNLNQTPTASPVNWSPATTYASGAHVAGTDGLVYSSLINGNINHDPTVDDGTRWAATGALVPWTTVFTGGSGSVKWLQIGGSGAPSGGVALTTLQPAYPQGTGPSSQASTRNVYKLPANFLRKAPQDPKAGSASVFGSPTNLAYDDWLIESGYIISAFSDVIVLRFVADIADVRLMHAMFCEGLGARIALEVVEPVTQSAAKKQTIAGEYQRFMSEARLADAIEEGATEEPLDDFIACRA